MEIVNAIEILDGHRAPKTQVSRLLEPYKDRGEFDGSIKSAITCLKLSGYEVDRKNL